MGYELPRKVRDLTPYEPVTGTYRIRCDANESCFPLSDELHGEVLRRMASLELNRYPDPYATECCEAMARRCGVDPSLVVAGNGSDELISLFETCLMEKGATLATLQCDFSMYEFYTTMAELRHVRIAKRPDLTIDPDAVIGALREQNASALLFSNPCNPSSLALPRAEVERIVRGTDALVIVDEAYMEFADESVLGLVGEVPNLMVFKTCSKAVGLAGARMGFAIGPKPIVGALRSAKSPYNVNMLSQAVAAAVLGAPGYVESCAKKLREYTAQLHAEITWIAQDFPRELGTVYPTSTNFVYFGARDAAGLRRGLMERGIAVRAMGDHLRISTGLPEENRELTKNLRDVLTLRAGRDAG